MSKMEKNLNNEESLSKIKTNTQDSNNKKVLISEVKKQEERKSETINKENNKDKNEVEKEGNFSS